MKRSPGVFGATGEIIKYANKGIMSTCDIYDEKNKAGLDNMSKADMDNELAGSCYGLYDYEASLTVMAYVSALLNHRPQLIKQSSRGSHEEIVDVIKVSYQWTFE